MSKELVFLSVEKLIPHPKNPRKNLGDLTELADSIKAKGVMQNLTVVPGESDDTYKIVIGHRRHAAAQLAGLEVLPCVIEEMTENEQVATMLLENIQRSELTVYEQAQGFQMMIDLGETPESIAALTGFSNSTVRRRLKMAELDQKKLKEISSDEARQISICDVDKLSSIKSKKVRNELLSKIGTSNFEYSYTSAIRDQENKEKLPHVEKSLKALGAQEFEKRSDRYSSEYEWLKTIRLEDYSIGDKITVNGKREKLYYSYDGYSVVSVYTEAKKKEKVKKSDKQIERERYIKETTNELKSLYETAFLHRKEFVKNLVVGKSNQALILRLATAALSNCLTDKYKDMSEKLLVEYFGKEVIKQYGAIDFDLILSKVMAPASTSYVYLPKFIHCMSRDNVGDDFYTGYEDKFPKFKKNDYIKRFIDVLCELGFELSDTEKQLLDGTHPLFTDRDKVKEGDK
ncbi:MAG: ParB/RepB/Spo0J family partition protein [Clostridia bacterium]|nr:ParB/RepB/Spo0J family partition protein [Clostridia bacterium]